MSTIDASHWRIVAPWYRWEPVGASTPEGALAAGRPALHKYATTDFVDEFLAEPRRSVAFVESVDRFMTPTLIPGAPATLTTPWPMLNNKELTPSPWRKLFLAAHQRHYIVAVDVRCDEAGFPRVHPDKIAEAGFVIRRRRLDVAVADQPAGAALVGEMMLARLNSDVQRQLDVAKARSRVLHPFRSAARRSLVDPSAAAIEAARQSVTAQRRLATWATAAEVGTTIDGWIGEGALGAWTGVPDTPEELIERTYPLRLLTADPNVPDHPARDGTIYYGLLPTASNETASDGSSRFDPKHRYELRTYVRVDRGDCPGELIWSEPSEIFTLASFFDPDGCAQNPVEIHLPDFDELAASLAPPSVKMNAPPNSTLNFAKDGGFPTGGSVQESEEICFFSIPLITIVALFLLNIVLPIVTFVFGLFWMLKLKFCIPPSIQFEADLEVALGLEPGEFSLTAEFDVDVHVAGDPAARAALDAALNAHYTSDLPGYDVASGIDADPVVKLLLDQGYGSSTNGAPDFTPTLDHTPIVERSEVMHP